MSQKLTKPETPKEIVKDKAEETDRLKFLRIGNDPNTIREKALKLIENKKEGEEFPSGSSNEIIKGMSLNEFESGVLLSTCISDLNTTFAIDLMRKLQKEYDCTTTSEKATAELAAMNYGRFLDVQRGLHTFLSKDAYGDLTIKIISVLSKELDRANRHYLTAIQTLRSLKTPPLAVNIKTQTAIVGENQLVQSNNQND